jgi:hypothetical protein
MAVGLFIHAHLATHRPIQLSAASADGNSHSIQVYSDISAEWVAGDLSLPVNWTTVTGDTLMHQVQLQNQTVFAESGDRALCRASMDSTQFYIDLIYRWERLLLNNRRMPYV